MSKWRLLRSPFHVPRGNPTRPDRGAEVAANLGPLQMAAREPQLRGRYCGQPSRQAVSTTQRRSQLAAESPNALRIAARNASVVALRVSANRL